MVSRFRKYLTTGLLVAGPLFVTGYLIWLVVTYVDDFMMDFIPDSLFGFELSTYTPGVGILITLIFLLFLGFFSVHILGASISSWVGYVIDRLPIVRAIYKLANQAFSIILSNKLDSFGQVVMVETPKKGLWALGFVCSDPSDEIASKLDREHKLVFVPTSPNPTSGFMMIVPKKDLKELKMSKEEAISTIISMGTISRISSHPEVKKVSNMSEEEEKKLLMKNLAVMKSKIDSARQDLRKVASKHKKLQRHEKKQQKTLVRKKSKALKDLGSKDQ